MRVGKIEQCICAKDDLITSGFAGMPVIQFYGGADSFCRITCPDCGRGGIAEFKSVYHALKDWNDMQERLKDQKNWNEMFR